MKRRSLLLAAALPLMSAAARAATAAAPALKAGVFEPAQPAPDFTLDGSDGARIAPARFKGRVVALVFGYTNCPAVCPTTLATLAQARKTLGADAADVQVLYVTVDPERDDLARIRQYLAAFDPTFVGASGAPERLAALRKRLGIVAEKVPDPAGGYGINHSSSIYLIDRAGRLRAMMPYGHDAKDYVHDFKLLLAAR